jgi:2-(1,2-epoxy-1,2-dihydrophenyl)acetyl-CoA isomerase
MSRSRCIRRVVSSDRLLEETLFWPKELAKRAPLSLRYAKDAVRTATGHGLDTTFDQEARLQMLCSVSVDPIGGVTAFMQKRTPEFKGR